ncbi:Vacuolar protein sorting protein [Reticulomyxa filosa]|uniref:Vacuolar protein sorting protein n=1 Tax=Reticulomyxa filosa TaxID=46433 RepID=X6LET5_RETFI|nr:Vacuolar protein sorting protein [Reticulomyxa filosa]|eukprot:ETO00079.1 Vacuolar protein sorting protein [Reticulomyxa filosa]
MSNAKENNMDNAEQATELSGTDTDQKVNFDFGSILNEINFEDLDLTTENVDLTDVDGLLKQFQDNKVVRDALEKNVNLGKYARKIEQDISKMELLSIQDYISNSSDLVQLHDQIKNCDRLLEEMQKILSGFQDHLKTISSDIRHLQDKSMSMSIELNNKKETEKQLDKYVRSLELRQEFIELSANINILFIYLFIT